MRTRLREEMQGQIVHDSIHRRDGWTSSFLLEVGGAAVGFGSVAIGGPWKDKPTAIEFYVLPAQRTRAFALFEAFLAASGARFLELQSNAPLLTEMALCLEHLGLPTDAPAFHAARPPPQAELLLDVAPAFEADPPSRDDFGA